MTGLRDIVERRIPILALDSGVPGPVVWLTACIHGDEPGGTAIIHDVVSHLRRNGLRSGRVNAFPLINSLGFENVSRYLTADREDLNRCFPGDPGGTMGERIAARLFTTIVDSEPALVIDLHNDWIHSVPYVLLEDPALTSDATTYQRSLELARATGGLLVMDAPMSQTVDGTLTAALVAAGIPAFTMEAGGACGIVESSVAAGVADVLAALAALGICAPCADSGSTASRVWRYTDEPRAGSSGLVRFAVAAGAPVAPGQVLARIYSAFGSCEETLLAAHEGLVLGLADHARTAPGQEVIALAV